MLVLADRNFLSDALARYRLATGAHIRAGLGLFPADPDPGAGRRQLPGPAASAANRRPAEPRAGL